MQKRTILASFFSFVVCAFLWSDCAEAQTLVDVRWWHNSLSQAQRNANILRIAQGMIGKQTNYSCKKFVQLYVVPTASKNVVFLPQNDPYCQWRWLYGPDVEVIATDRWDGVVWPAGSIMQAQVSLLAGGTSEHTMIIQSANSVDVTIIDCNWKLTGLVRRKTYTWAEFKGFCRHYTLYQVK